MSNPCSRQYALKKFYISFLIFLIYTILFVINLVFIKFRFSYDKTLYIMLYLIILPQVIESFCYIGKLSFGYLLNFFYLILIIPIFISLPLMFSIPLSVVCLFLANDLIYEECSNIKDKFKKKNR